MEEATLETTDEAPEGFPIADLPERPEEFSPGLTPELVELVESAAGMRSNGGRLRSNVGPRRDAPRSKKFAKED